MKKAHSIKKIGKLDLKAFLNFILSKIFCAIWSRFEVHYTPKHASWLNQAEIAIGM